VNQEQDQLKDIFDSFFILNYLYACMYGALEGQKTLLFLESNHFSQTENILLEKNLEKVTNWSKSLFDQSPLLSSQWKKPESFEAQQAFELLDKVRSETIRITSEILRILSFQTLKTSADDIKYILYVTTRYYASKYTHFQGFLDFGNSMNLGEFISMYHAPTANSWNEFNSALEFVQLYKELLQQNSPNQKESIESGHLATLQKIAFDLPCFFSVQIHELTMHLSYFDDEFTFQKAGFNSEDAKLWEEHKFTPREAGFWRAFRFTPEEASKWIEKGFQAAAVCYNWKGVGFNVETALPWAEQNIPPSLAKKWADAKYSPEQTITYLNQNILEPSALKTKKKK
jgi:hypothetical protein